MRSFKNAEDENQERSYQAVQEDRHWLQAQAVLHQPHPDQEEPEA